MAARGRSVKLGRMALAHAARATAVLVAITVVGASCSGDDEAGGGPDAGGTDTEASVDEATAEAGEPAGTGACDDTDPAACLLPWPSDTYTRADPSTATGLRLDVPADGTPTNAGGTPVDPTEWNRNDGFSPAAIALTVVPFVDPDASGLPPQTDIGASLEAGSPLALVDLDLGERVPAWAEVDSTVTDPARAPLRIVPARALTPGHRHAVGLWDLRRADGGEVEPSPAFARLVADPTTEQQEWLDGLAGAGRPTEDLDMAWSFTVASSDGLTARLRHMWQEAADDLGVGPDGGPTDGGAPPFRVDSAVDSGDVRLVRGSFDMPKYLTGDGGTGTVLDNDGDPDGIPRRNGTMPAPFTCVLPTTAGPSPAVVYGHGLLGDRSEVEGIGRLGASVGIGFCALDFIGMSSDDVPTVLEFLGDLSAFRTLPDRLQQGHLGFALLGRLLASPEGFATDPSFLAADGTPLVDPGALSFLGASQGGILGAASTAISPDWSRAILAVGGLGYNLLLGRSIDFDAFGPALEAGYPDPLDRAIALELLEGLWDRGESAGWATHLTVDPLPEGGPPTEVLLLEAFGDHQVANVSTEKLARTLGVPRQAPTLTPGRSPDREPFFGIEPIGALPHAGSGLVVWDFGTPAPPTANTPPREGEDPHGKLTDVPAALALVAAFVQPDGVIPDVCGGGPCTGPG